MGNSSKNKNKKDQRLQQHQKQVENGDNEEEVEESRFDTEFKPHFAVAAASAQQKEKLVLDERFASVLTDDRFQLDTTRDKYGRKKNFLQKKKNEGKETMNNINNKNNELNAFYTLAKNDNPNKEGKDDDKKKRNDGDDEDHKKKPKNESVRKDSGVEKLDDWKEKTNMDKDPASRIAYLTALSRGEIDVSSSDEDDDDADGDSNDDSEDDEGPGGKHQQHQEEDEEIMGQVGILDPSYHKNQKEGNDEEAELTFEPSRYLAVCNMDWSHVRAVDIFAIMSSFAPPGAVQKVQVFPSYFGQAQMAKEDTHGPSSDLWKETKPKPSVAAKELKDDNNAQEDEEEEHSSSNDDESFEEKNDDAKAKDFSGDDNGNDSGKSFEQSGNDGGGQEVEEEDDNDDDDDPLEHFLPKEDHVESDFDPEKLRAYEASRLKYYFAVVTFAEAEQADVCYHEVDGMEFEHSSASLDVRAIPETELASVVANRPIRDEASSVPSNYAPPDFIVSALQQTNVKCTWEAGDADRDRALTKYHTSGQDWQALAEGGADDLRAYLASDASSDDEEEDDDDEVDESGDGDDNKKEKKKGGSMNKAAMMRQMLALDKDEDENDGTKAARASDEDEEEEENKAIMASFGNHDDAGNDSSGGNNESEEEEDGKEARFIPGSRDLAEKIRFKVEQKSTGGLTPWEKYQQKRKEKKKEKKQAARELRQATNKSRRQGRSNSNHDPNNNDDNDEYMLLDSRPSKKHESFFLNDDDDDDGGDGATKEAKKKSLPAAANMESTGTTGTSKNRKKIQKEELELLVAGEDAEEEKRRDYDMRGLQRMEKNKDKKLRGSRKRKEAQLAANVAGTDFVMDLKDDRFSALLDGQDERFGIDRTDPIFKDTPAMREVMAEQGRRRHRSKKKRRTDDSNDKAAVNKSVSVAPNVVAGQNSGPSDGASALSSLISRLKSKVH